MQAVNPAASRRREFIGFLAAGSLGLVLRGASAGPKPLRGIFPIAQTPFTGSDKLDVAALVNELKFCDRAGAHGFVWPQLASEYSTLTEAERLAGTEAVAAAGKRLRPAVVIGVQGPDVAAAVKYARHASRNGADAIISLPPPNQKDPEALLEYYSAVGKSCDLPLFAQAVGNVSVDLLVRMTKAVPTLQYVKDEAGGSPLGRIGPLREQSGDRLKVFTGGHGVTLIDEMRRGSSGSMPAASFADIYASVWDLWQAGRRKEAMDLFGKALLLITEIQVYGIQSLKYILHVRGVFPTYAVRSKDARVPLDDAAKQVIRDMLDFAKPYLKA